MEEKKSIKPHSILWKDRKQGSITGVTEVVSFDDTGVLLDTEQGMLSIKGKELHIGRLDLDKGEVELTGAADSFSYQGSSPAKKGSLIKRLLQ